MVVTLPCLLDQQAVVGETSGAALHSSLMKRAHVQMFDTSNISACSSFCPPGGAKGPSFCSMDRLVKIYKVLNLWNQPPVQRADRAVSSKDAVGKSATCWTKVSTLESLYNISGTLPVHQRPAASSLQQRWQILVQKVKSLPVCLQPLSARSPGSVLPEEPSAGSKEQNQLPGSCSKEQNQLPGHAACNTLYNTLLAHWSRHGVTLAGHSSLWLTTSPLVPLADHSATSRLPSNLLLCD
ncbi:uncharacterized protein LOC119126838 isoform X2 [Syngnathus acus]|uniref:uncharacterized protein LOC119126838 isoform X2 n=1 Tax=Syngnathus acus TaxID=161584 RepID=UPI001885DC2D|nr:uncharacterized protein LOC119126838 isoform X2 [Syngnathus acus]